MTPREPDRFEAKAREILRQDAIDVIRSHFAPPLADLMIRALAFPAAAPAAEVCRAEVASRMPDYSHYECTLPKGHVGPHKEGSFAEWTDATTVAAQPSEPAAPAHPQSPEIARAETAQGAEAPDAERDRNRHNAMLVEAWRGEFGALCKALFPGDDGPIGWKHIHAKIAELLAAHTATHAKGEGK